MALVLYSSFLVLVVRLLPHYLALLHYLLLPISHPLYRINL